MIDENNNINFMKNWLAIKVNVFEILLMHQLIQYDSKYSI